MPGALRQFQLRECGVQIRIVAAASLAFLAPRLRGEGSARRPEPKSTSPGEEAPPHTLTLDSWRRPLTKPAIGWGVHAGLPSLRKRAQAGRGAARVRQAPVLPNAISLPLSDGG